MRTPADVLTGLLAHDPGAPRITTYDESTGERIELSAKVLANWVAKAANVLTEEFAIEPGTIVLLDLPPHWRSAYWAMAVWSVGAHVWTDQTPGDILVTTDPAAELADEGNVLVTLAALARRGEHVPDGFFDEARELATFPDDFVPDGVPDGTDLALNDDTYATLSEHLGGPHPRVRAHTSTTELALFLHQLLAVWAGNGSVVLTRGELTPKARSARIATELISVDLDTHTATTPTRPARS